MLNQVSAFEPKVWVDNILWPAVTNMTIEAVRPETSSHQPDLTQTEYTVTLQRRLPVGLGVGNLYPKINFDLTVSDGWNIFSFSGCNWISTERIVDAEGVTEITRIYAASLGLR